MEEAQRIMIRLAELKNEADKNQWTLDDPLVQDVLEGKARLLQLQRDLLNEKTKYYRKRRWTFVTTFVYVMLILCLGVYLFKLKQDSYNK